MDVSSQRTMNIKGKSSTSCNNGCIITENFMNLKGKSSTSCNNGCIITENFMNIKGHLSTYVIMDVSSQSTL